MYVILLCMQVCSDSLLHGKGCTAIKETIVGFDLYSRQLDITMERVSVVSCGAGLKRMPRVARVACRRLRRYCPQQQPSPFSKKINKFFLNTKLH